MIQAGSTHILEILPNVQNIAWKRCRGSPVLIIYQTAPCPMVRMMLPGQVAIAESTTETGKASLAEQRKSLEAKQDLSVAADRFL